MRDLRRRCPNCGHRGVRTLESKLVSTERETEQISTNPVALSVNSGPGIISDGVYKVPLAIERDEYELSLECKACHHRWTEKKENVSKGK
jgi:hypothetical protein